MTTDRNDILSRLEDTETNVALVRKLKSLLMRNETRVLANRHVKVTVSEAIRLWSTRLQNTKVTGQQLDGAQALLHQLKGLTPQRKLEQIALISDDIAGNLFFEGSTPHRFVGAVISHRPNAHL
jgi:hypothetical protein